MSRLGFFARATIGLCASVSSSFVAQNRFSVYDLIFSDRIIAGGSSVLFLNHRIKALRVFLI
jgi:hypothetical protein